jgi:hypothetical protein
MTDMSSVIVPKSDQINADSLLSGPITIKITQVAIKAGSEQPVTVSYEGDDGKPWRPCKSMARCLVAAWGPDSSKYIGRSLTLYCDPKVRWGGMEVGGIRISHMSDIDGALTMALTVTRANKKPYTVRPLTKAAAKEPAPPASSPDAAASTVPPDGAEATAEAGTHEQNPTGTNGYAFVLPGATEPPDHFATPDAWFAKWASMCGMVEGSDKLRPETKVAKIRALKEANERIIRSMGAAMVAKISGDMATRTANINVKAAT